MPIRSRTLCRPLAVALSALVLGAQPAVADDASPAATGSVVGSAVAVPPPADAAPAAGTVPPVAAAATAQSVARAAGAAAVTIRDFRFVPAAIAIHAGDTVTWTNDGPTAHTATGSGFDSGVLARGRSASHTFTSAGTFSYHCRLHPFMHGTVTVLAAASSAPPPSAAAPSSSGSPPAATPPASAPASAAASGPTLPNTGLDALQVAALGALSLLGGLALRRATRPR